LPTPVIFRLAAGGPSVDMRYDARVPKLGPNAKVPLINRPHLEAGSENIMLLLDDVPPSGAKRMKVSGVDERTMAWMFDSQAPPEPHRLAAAVGKPETLWGIPGYYTATAQGIVCWLQQSLESLAGQRVILQGFGETGSALASLLATTGARLISVADVSGGLHNPNGLDAGALRQHVQHQGVLFGYPQAEAICNAEVLETECDVLILAAAERQITIGNASRVRSRLVIEATRNSVTRAAEQALLARGISLVPHLIATAGTVLAGFAEWSWNVHSELAAPPELSTVIAARMQRLREAIDATAREHAVPFRQAALILAIKRIAQQMRLTRI